MWFTLGLISFFLIAITAISDKFLLTKSKLSPLNYVFLISILGAVASTVLLVIEPHFFWPKEQIFPIILSGAGFFFGVYFLYLVVIDQEATKVNSIINSLVPIFTFLMAMFLVVEDLTLIRLIGAALVVISSYFLSQVGLEKEKFRARAIILMIVAALMFALNHVFSKVVYQELPFFDSFIWIRWSILAVALVYLTVTGNWGKIFPNNQKEIKEKASVKTQWLILLFGQACGAIAILLYQYAVKLGSVTLVTSLQGTQFFFMLIMALILTKYYPNIFRENFSPKVIREKFILSIFLFAGVLLVVI